MTIYITRENDMLDRVAWKHYGSTENSVVESVLLANPNLADYGPILPENLTIILPDIPTPEKRPGIRLWD